MRGIVGHLYSAYKGNCIIEGGHCLLHQTVLQYTLSSTSMIPKLLLNTVANRTQDWTKTLCRSCRVWFLNITSMPESTAMPMKFLKRMMLMMMFPFAYGLDLAMIDSGDTLTWGWPCQYNTNNRRV